MIKSAGAMFEQRVGDVGGRRQKVCLILAVDEFLTLQERDQRVQNSDIPCYIDKMGDAVGEPDTIVRNACTHANAGIWLPPMLHITFEKLSRRGAQKMFPRDCGPGYGQRHAVLELISKSIGPTCLVKRGTCPGSTCEGLIQEPAVEHDIHATVGCADLNRAKQLLPIAMNFGQHGIEIRRAELADQGSRFVHARGFPKEEDQLVMTVGGQFNCRSERTTRIQTRPHAVREWPGMDQRGWALERSIATDEFASVAGPVRLTSAEVGERDP